MMFGAGWELEHMLICKRREGERICETADCASLLFVERSPHSRPGSDGRRDSRPRQHFLNFLPLPQGQGSLRPTPLNGSTNGWGMAANGSRTSSELVAHRSSSCWAASEKAYQLESS